MSGGGRRKDARLVIEGQGGDGQEKEGKGSRKGRETHEGISVSIIVIIHLGLFPAYPPPRRG